MSQGFGVGGYNADGGGGGGGGTSPAAPDGAVQFNDGGAFGGSADFTFDGTNVLLPPMAIPDNDGAALHIFNVVGNAQWLNYSTLNGAEIAQYGDPVGVVGGPVQHTMYSPDNAFAFNVRSSVSNRNFVSVDMVGDRVVIGNGVDVVRLDFQGDGFIWVGSSSGSDAYIQYRARGTGTPPISAGSAQTWVAFTAGNIELFYADNNGGGSQNVVQLTAGGQIGGAAAPAYTPTNVTTDRSFDADVVLIAELADVLGTLIQDLQAKGILV